MTLATTPRIRCWKPSAAVVSVTGAHLALKHFVFLFYF
jgi:hypothetical protein